MSYSCSDFTDDVLNRLRGHGLLEDKDIPDDDPEEQAGLALEAIDLLVAKHNAAHEQLLTIGAQHPAWSPNPDDALVRIFNDVTKLAREAVGAEGGDDDAKAEWCGHALAALAKVRS